MMRRQISRSSSDGVAAAKKSGRVRSSSTRSGTTSSISSNRAPCASRHVISSPGNPRTGLAGTSAIIPSSTNGASRSKCSSAERKTSAVSASWSRFRSDSYSSSTAGTSNAGEPGAADRRRSFALIPAVRSSRIVSRSAARKPSPGARAANCRPTFPASIACASARLMCASIVTSSATRTPSSASGRKASDCAMPRRFVASHPTQPPVRRASVTSSSRPKLTSGPISRFRASGCSRPSCSMCSSSRDGASGSVTGARGVDMRVGQQGKPAPDRAGASRVAPGSDRS